MVDISLEKVLPYNLEVERLILGYILTTGSMTIQLEESDFYYESHRVIWKRMWEMDSAGKAPDLMTLTQRLRETGDYEAVGGAAYLVSLTDGIPHYREGLSSQYVEILKELKAKRAGIQIGNELTARCYEDAEPFRDIANDTFAGIDTLLSSLDRQSGPRPIADAISDTFKQIENIADRKENPTGIKTGFADLDKIIIRGFQPKEMAIIAGRPGHGKTSLLLNMARRQAADGVPLVIFSLEMSESQLVQRMIADLANVQLSRMATGFCSKEDWSNISRACGDLAGYPIWIDDTPGLTVADIRSRTRRIRADIRAILVDYLQLIAPAKNMAYRSDVEKISSISIGLVNTAKSMNKALIANAQLSRKSEDRKDPTPKVADLRQSGQIEQDADVVILIHRPELSSSYAEVTGMASIIVGKQRSGATGTIQMAFDAQRSAFADLYQEEEYY